MFSFIGVTGDEVLSLLLFVTSKRRRKLPRGGGSGGKDVTACFKSMVEVYALFLLVSHFWLDHWLFSCNCSGE